jgi:hypothetical protein
MTKSRSGWTEKYESVVCTEGKPRLEELSKTKKWKTKKWMDGWMGGWMDGWMDGWTSSVPEAMKEGNVQNEA